MMRRTWTLRCLSSLFCIVALLSAAPQNPQHAKEIVAMMAETEVQAQRDRNLFYYISEERSTRTGGHLWKEKVVERKEGVLRRLIGEDGKALDATRASSEDRRLSDFVAHPDAFARANRARRDDERRASQLLAILPRAFLLEPAGSANGCERIAFRPDPSFQPSSLEERVMHTMAGYVDVKLPDERLCGIEAHMTQRVDLAFGLLGHINPGGGFSMHREQISPSDWKTSHITVHLDGKILLLKSVSRDQESSRSDFHSLAPNLTLAAAAVWTRP